MTDSKTNYEARASQEHVFMYDPNESEAMFETLNQEYDHFLQEAKPDSSIGLPSLDGYSTLQYAALHGYHYFIEKMDPKIIKEDNDSEQINALYLAAAKGNLRTVMVLISKGADVSHIDTKSNFTALHGALNLPMLHDNAQRANKEQIFNLLYERAPALITAQSYDGETPCHAIALHGYITLLKKVFARSGASPFFIANNAGRLPIHTAILNGQLEIALNLLQIDNMAEVMDGRNRTLLHYAIQANNLPIIQYLCKKAPQLLQIHDSDGNTPLEMLHTIDTINPEISNYFHELLEKSKPNNRKQV